MKLEKPTYYLKLDMRNCIRIVSVNGFELDADFDGGGISRNEIPINHVIKNGKNYIELMVPPEEYFEAEEEKNLTCNVEVWVEGDNNGENKHYKVTDIDFLPDYSNKDKSSLYKNSLRPGRYSYDGDGRLGLNSSGEISVDPISIKESYLGDGEDVLYREFLASVPFPVWEFFSAEKIFEYPYTEEINDALESVVWPMVEELREVFAEKNINKILPLFEVRSKEYDQAFYREPGRTLRELKNSIESVWEAEYPMNNKDTSLIKCMFHTMGDWLRSPTQLMVMGPSCTMWNQPI